MTTINHGEYTIEIQQDMEPESPREWDNLGTMVCFHRRYNLGDKDNGYNHKDYNNWHQMEKAIRTKEKVAVILPIYMYDHSGLTVQTTPFSCPWDSGQIGFIFVSKDKSRKEFGKLTKKVLEKLTSILHGEVETFNQYLGGDIYGYIIKDKDEQTVDSCWNFYGEKYCIEAAKAACLCLTTS
jgi:hypothetical protein